MDVKLRAAIAAGFDGISISGLSAELGVSRRWIYELRRRFEADGVAGLEPRSRRPKRSPHQLSAGVEDAVARLRKELSDAGLDGGPATIQWHLKRRGETVPSVAAIWRVLKRRGLIEPQPQKRPKSSYQRFEAALVNEMWQIDATKWRLGDGSQVEIINIIDDHSRACVASHAVATTTGVAVFASFIDAGEHWGFPASILSDNATYFTGKRRGWEAPFETALKAMRIKAITSTPNHPTTCGKVERFHQTLKKWLKAQDPANTIKELQTLLDRFIDYYNRQRPHRAHRQTPADIHNTDPRTGPGTIELDQPTLTRHLCVNNDGIINTSPWRIGVGATWTGHQVTLFIQGLDAAVFSGDQLVRALTIDPDRSYQPTGNPRGGPRHPRQPKPILLPMTRDIV
ncbi:MAG: IS481 family transposase [bacterium]|nr:IS481 family transposase [bacterium]